MPPIETALSFALFVQSKQSALVSWRFRYLFVSVWTPSVSYNCKIKLPKHNYNYFYFNIFRFFNCFNRKNYFPFYVLVWCIFVPFLASPLYRAIQTVSHSGALHWARPIHHKIIEVSFVTEKYCQHGNGSVFGYNPCRNPPGSDLWTTVEQNRTWGKNFPTLTTEFERLFYSVSILNLFTTQFWQEKI